MSAHTLQERTTHTPGPWDRTKDGRLPIVIVGGETMIASVGANLAHGPITYLENTANARLIAAAPDLLEALKTAAAAFDYTVAALAKGQTVSMGSLQNCAASARQAIARAEGRT